MPCRVPVSFVATTKPEEAEAFYANVMGLQLVERSPYALVFADGENVLRVQIVEELTAAAHTVHGWQTSDIAGDIAEFAARGAEFIHFKQMDQDAAGVWTTPDGNKIAWFKDPCGNILSLTEYSES